MKAPLRRVIGLLAVVLLLCPCACVNKPLSQKALLHYIAKDDRLTQVRQFGDITVKAMFYPGQFLVYQELQTGMTNGKVKAVDSLEKKYAGQYYFRLSFSKDHQEAIRALGSFSRYSDMVRVLSFDMGRYANMTTETGDTAYVKDFVFDQDYGASDANTVILAFSKDKLKDSKAIYLNVGELGLGTGAITFKFDQSELEACPRLDYAAM